MSSTMETRWRCLSSVTRLRAAAGSIAGVWVFLVQAAVFIVSALALLAGMTCAEPAGEWLTGATGAGTARWSIAGPALVYRGGATFGWAVLPIGLTDILYQAE